MKKEDMAGLARFDDAVDRLANGCYTLPSNDISKYDIRAMLSEVQRIGRPLTDREAEKFVFGK